MASYFVYILSSKSRCLYVGVTNDIARRLFEHKESTIGHTARYNIHRLVHIEEFGSIDQAIQREKQIKGWLRSKKIDLIETHNPTWVDFGTDIS